MADADQYSSDSWQNILRRVERGDNGLNTGGLQQAAHHHGFGFFHRVEHFHQFVLRPRSAIVGFGAHGPSQVTAWQYASPAHREKRIKRFPLLS